jgi:hypothetical protein
MFVVKFDGGGPSFLLMKVDLNHIHYISHSRNSNKQKPYYKFIRIQT